LLLEGNPRSVIEGYRIQRRAETIEKLYALLARVETDLQIWLHQYSVGGGICLRTG